MLGVLLIRLGMRISRVGCWLSGGHVAGRRGTFEWAYCSMCGTLLPDDLRKDHWNEIKETHAV